MFPHILKISLTTAIATLIAMGFAAASATAAPVKNIVLVHGA